MGYKKLSQEFKMNVIKDHLSQNPPNISETARKYDLSPSSITLWKKKYGNPLPMKKSKKIKEWTPEQKLDIVVKTSSMSEQELGEFLRSNGMHSSDLKVIKDDLISSLGPRGRPKLDPEITELRKKNKILERKLRKNESALAEYAARVILLKKSHEIWGTKEDDE